MLGNPLSDDLQSLIRIGTGTHKVTRIRVYEIPSNPVHRTDPAHLNPKAGR